MQDYPEWSAKGSGQEILTGINSIKNTINAPRGLAPVLPLTCGAPVNPVNPVKGFQ